MSWFGAGSVMTLRRIVLVSLLFEFQCVMGREVHVPPGPLYRVSSFSLSLPCTVSDYKGPRKQNFQWYLHTDRPQTYQIVSTADSTFTYAKYGKRVESGEIRVERDSDDKVRLVIQKLSPTDQGSYECATPSTDRNYEGTYSAKVTVNVIPDKLLVNESRTVNDQPVIEGTELQLSCAASVPAAPHTHLSVTFSMRGGTGPNLRKIISVDHELRVTPGLGGSYDNRFKNGEIMLEKRNGDEGRDLYILKISRLILEDSGSYFCEAAQWIFDPSGQWEQIAQRTVALGNLTVQPLSNTVSVSTLPMGQMTLQPDSPLTLSCQVSGIGPWNRSSLLVRWVRRPLAGGVEVEVAQMSPNGVVSWVDDLSRERGGSFEKEADGKFSLRRFSVHPADAGFYRCAVSVYAGQLSPGPSSIATLTQKSEDILVKFSTKEVSVVSTIWLPRQSLLKRGDTITLLCNVSVKTSELTLVEVRWLQRKEGTEESASLTNQSNILATLTHDGMSRIHTNESEVSVDRIATRTYRLRIFSAQDNDKGYYQCQAAVWAQSPRGDWYHTGSSADSSMVRVYLYARVSDLLLIPLVVGISSALFVGAVIIGTVTCCFMNRLAKQRSQRRK